MRFDPSCWDLAESFLHDGPRCLPKDIEHLAQAIQDVCESHCQMIEEEEKAADLLNLSSSSERNIAGLILSEDKE